MLLVMQCFSVAPGFTRAVAASVNSHVLLKTWVQQVSFPVNTSSHMHRLLYFFCVQSTRVLVTW
jgi:hypothetical protein